VEGHLAYLICEVVNEMDLSEIFAHYEKEERGQPPYNPRMMTKILLYAYCKGVRSSRKMAQRLEEDVGFRVLAANNQPARGREHGILSVQGTDGLFGSRCEAPFGKGSVRGLANGAACRSVSSVAGGA